MMKDEILQRIKNAMRDKRMSQTMLARKIKRTQQSVSSRLSGKYIPREKTLRLIANALKIEISDREFEKLDDERGHGRRR